MSRIYAIESSPSLSGAMADHRLVVKASEVEGLARALAAAVGLPVEGGAREHADWIAPLAKDLRARGGASLVVAGETQPPAVHALAHAHQSAPGQRGKDGRLHRERRGAAFRPERGACASSRRRCTRARSRSSSSSAANPVYDAPADLDFATAMDKVGLRVKLGLYEDETTERCHWHVPAAHSLEAWGDARAADGTVTILQPLLAPLYGGKSPHEFMAALVARERPGYEIVKEHWKEKDASPDFDKRWERWLHDGVVPGTALPEQAVTVTLGDWARTAAPAGAAGLELVFRPDPSLHDGRYANNGWLQELQQAPDQADLGQRGDRVAGHREAARPAHAPGDAAGIGHGRASSCGSAAARCGRRPGSSPVIPTAP